MAIDGFDDSAKERLSALADGELDPAGSTASCAAWARDAALRADWHAALPAFAPLARESGRKQEERHELDVHSARHAGPL